MMPPLGKDKPRSTTRAANAARIPAKDLVGTRIVPVRHHAKGSAHVFDRSLVGAKHTNFFQQSAGCFVMPDRCRAGMVLNFMRRPQTQPGTKNNAWRDKFISAKTHLVDRRSRSALQGSHINSAQQNRKQA